MSINRTSWPSALSGAAQLAAEVPCSSSVGPLRLPKLGRSIACCRSIFQSSTATRVLTTWLMIALPPAKIGGPDEPGLIGRLREESQYGPNAGLTEVLIPAGYVRIAYDAVFALSQDRKEYVGAASAKPTAIPAPGLPFSLVFRAEPGKEDIVLKIASAYEAASQRRVPPPAFGPLPSTARS